MRFREAVLTDADVQWVQVLVRQRVLRWFTRQGYLDKDDAKDMAQWSSGGFSVDASVRIEANDRAGLERRLRYCARPPFALERLQAIDAHRLIYRLPKPRPDGSTDLILSPLELIGRLAALIPPPSRPSSPLPWGAGAECHIACRSHGVGPGGLERCAKANGARKGDHGRCRRGPFPPARPLPVGYALGTHLRVCPTRLSPVRRRYADHRFRNGWRFCKPNTEAHPRVCRSPVSTARIYV